MNLIRTKSDFFSEILQPSHFTAKVTFTEDQWADLRKQGKENEETKTQSTPQFIFDFIERTLNSKLLEDQSSEIFVLQYEPFDYCINLLYRRKNADQPLSCFTKLRQKVCKTEVPTVSDISE